MLYRKAWRLGYILPNRLDNMQHSFYVTVHFSVTAFDLESFLPSLWVDSIPYESICWRGINVGGLAVER